MTDTLLKKIESLVNKVIAADLQSQIKLAELAGKRILIEFQDLQLQVLIIMNEQGISLEPGQDQSADVSLSANLSAFIGLIVNRRMDRNLFPNNIDLKGDIHLAQDFQSILLQLDLDWEEHVSHWLGDSAARKLGLFVRANRKWLGDTHSNLKRDISEYLRFEIEMLPDLLMVEEFNRAVDDCRDDVERLQQRIQQFRS